MAVVFSSDADRAWYRDVLISPDELFCSPQATNAPPKRMFRPVGVYDAAAYVKSLPAPWSDPSLFVVLDDVVGNSAPRNLAGLKCPKVLIVCDTHHICAPGQGPIWRPLQHALTEKYDLVIGQFDRQHLHFFREAGINAAWLPCLTLTPFEQPLDTEKKHDITFVGQTGRHPFRKHVLEQLAALGFPIVVGAAPQRDTALLHAQSRINLNISLNGDLNLRHFEVLAAGGFLITERLSPESGQSLLLEDRRHMVAFDNVAQLGELIRYHLSNPALLSELAAAGRAEYQRSHHPSVKIRQFHELVAGKTPDLLDLRLDRRTLLPAQDHEALRDRVAIYEFLQEIHRSNLRPEVLFWPGTERNATDAIDLHRLKVSLFQGNPTGAAPIIAAQLDARVQWILPANLPRLAWNVAIVPAAVLSDASFRQCLQTRRFDAITIAGFQPQRDNAALQEVVQQFRLRPIANKLSAFALPPAGG